MVFHEVVSSYIFDEIVHMPFTPGFPTAECCQASTWSSTPTPYSVSSLEDWFFNFHDARSLIHERAKHLSDEDEEDDDNDMHEKTEYKMVS